MEYRLVNAHGAEWDFSHNERMERYILDITKDNEGIDLSAVIESSGALLQYGQVGDHLYDLVLELYTPNVKMTDVKDLMRKLVSQVKIFDFVITSRRILVSTHQFGADVLSKLMKLMGLVIQAYNLGRLEGVISAKEKVVVADVLDPFEVGTLIALELNRRPKLNKLIANFKPIYDTNVKRYSRYLKGRDPYFLTESLSSLEDKKLVEIANNIFATTFYSYTSNFFNEVDDYFFPNYDLLSSGAWERENTINPSSAVILFYLYFVENCVAPDVLKHRKFYVRDKGVKLVFDKPTNGITSIEVREFHNSEEPEEHILNFFYTVETGEIRMFYLSMNDITASTVPLMFEKDADVIMMVLAWLGLLDGIRLTPNKLLSDISTNKKIKTGRSKELTLKEALPLVADFNRWIQMAVKAMNPENYYYETPAQWNYDSKNANVLNKTLQKTGTRIIKVGRYTRRLPEGQKPSAEAIALAKKYYIELKDNHTIVDEFERMHKR